MVIKNLEYCFNLLLKEYSECQNGYNSRDTIVITEFSFIVTLISILFVILQFFSGTDITSIAYIENYQHVIFVFFIGIIGLISLLALSIDMASAISVKTALRKRMIDIEKIINNLMQDEYLEYRLLFWRSIDKRDRYKIEKLKVRNLFVNSSYLILIIWTIIVLFFIAKSYSFNIDSLKRIVLWCIFYLISNAIILIVLYYNGTQRTTLIE